MNVRRLGGVFVAAALALWGCSSSPSETDRTDATVDTVPGSTVEWLPCGSIECARIDVPRTGSDLAGETITVAAYRRMSTNESAPVLFLLPDHTHGFSAREAVESAPLTLGAASNDFTLISISPRGSTDSPVLLADVNILSALDVMDDVVAVQTALNIDEAAVLGWGSGATTAAALVMSYPGRVSAAVLDAPQDPSVSMVRQAEKQLESMKASVETAMRWCASHLSCPSNANVAKELSRFKTNLRLGRLGEGVDFGTVARAATRSISDGDPQSFFIALNEASNGNVAALLSLAGPVPTAESSRASCADVTLSASKRIASLFAAHIASKPRHFYMGTEAQTYGFCPGLPATQRPIGAVEPDPEAMNAPVFVTIARGNPVVPPYTPRTMAKRMGWTYKSVYANRHLVIGYDQAITRAAFEFLASSLDD